MANSLQVIGNLFDRYGWKYNEQDKKTLLVGFQGENKDFIIGVRLHDNDGWLTLTIPDYLPPVPPNRQDEVYRHLLELNSRIIVVRFALESELNITVMVDLPLQKKLDYDLFAMTIGVLSFYADDAYPHLYKLITGEELKRGDNPSEQS